MKLKTLLILILIGIIQHSFGQKVNLLSLKSENGKYLIGNIPYNGLVYELYASGFLKTESEIKNGVNNGLVKKYTDNTKSISTYQDSIKLKQYDDTLSYLSKRLFQLYKDSANYSVKIKRIFDEEIKTSEKLDEWKQKYDDGKLRGNKLEIYTELRNASFGLDASMTDLKLVRSNNLYFQRERKTEKNKPVYTNILSETYTYVDGNQLGIHITYKKGGEKDVEETLDNGKNNGPYKRYSGSKIVEEGNYVNNEKEGVWTTLNSSEKITQNYSKGKLNGEYKRYVGDDLLESGQFVEGLKNGEWKKFDYYARLIELTNFKLDKLDGTFKKYSGGPDVLTENGQYVEGLKNGEWKNFDYSGKLTLFQNYKLGKLDGLFKKYSGDVVIEEGIYANGLMNGVWKFYYNSGKIKGSGKFLNSDGGNVGSTGMPINGREGIWILYHENGNKSQECNYTNGKKEGKFIAYHENGNKSEESTYFNGKEEGIFKLYYESGKIKQESTYLDGQFNGQSKTFHENGNLRTLGVYINGKVEGDYKWYREDGTLETLSDYRNGISLSQINFDRSGNKIEKEDSYSSNNTRSNSSYTKIMCNGHVMDRRYIDNAFRLEINLIVICPYCHDHIKRQWVTFTNGRKGDCDEREFECRDCGKICILKPCLIKALDEDDEF